MKARRCCHFQGSPHTCVWEGFCPSRRECWVIVFQGLWKSGEPSKAPQVGVFTDMVIRSWETCPRFQILHLLHSDHRLLCMPRHHGKLLAPKWNTPYCYLLCRTSQVSCRLAGRKVLGWWCRQGVGRRPGLSGVSITHTWTQASFTFCPMTAMCDLTACLWEALIGTWRAFKRMMLSVALCVSVMDFEFILKVAERRIRAALNQTEPGKGLFLMWGGGALSIWWRNRQNRTLLLDDINRWKLKPHKMCVFVSVICVRGCALFSKLVQLWIIIDLLLDKLRITLKIMMTPNMIGTWG